MEKISAWYPPMGEPPTSTSEDADQTLNFQSQRTTGGQPKLSEETIEGNEEVDKKIKNLKRKRKRKFLLPSLENGDLSERVEDLNVPRYDQKSYGPSYGHPDFYARLIPRLSCIAKKIRCTCR